MVIWNVQPHFLGCVAACVAACGPMAVPSPPGAETAGSIVFLARGAQGWVAATRGSSEGQVRFEVEGSATILAGLYPVSLAALRLAEGEVELRESGRRVPLAESVLIHDDSEEGWRPLGAWPMAVEDVRLEESPGGRDGVVEVGVAERTSCALRGDGRVSCWGYGPEGELAVRGLLRAETPVEGLARGIDQLTVGHGFNCGTDRDRDVLCWGSASAGQLGRFDRSDTAAPGRVSEVSDAVMVGAGSFHACALSSAGRVSCWGRNSGGEVSPESQTEFPIPSLVALPAPAAELAVGLNHSCARLPNGEVWCWGLDNSLQLGAEGLGPGPVRIEGIRPAGSLAVGERHSCVRQTDGFVWCWGSNQAGQLGAKTEDPASVPILSSLSATQGELKLGTLASCVLDPGRPPVCVGRSTRLELLPEPLERLGPVRSLGLRGTEHACAVTLDGIVKCWGWGGLGQLGCLSSLTRRTPVEVPGTHTAREVWAEGTLTCVGHSDGSVSCSGAPSLAVIPLETWSGSSLSPVQPFVDFSSGGSHECVVRADSEVACVGENTAGQLGLPLGTAWTTLLTNVPGLRDVRAVVAGSASTYAILGNGELWGWGANQKSELGIGRAGEPEGPVRILVQAHQVASRGDSACAVSGADRSVLCWGDNSRGELGLGRLAGATAPERVALPGPTRSLDAGAAHYCAALEDGSLWCWGLNESGQLGDGGTQKSWLPVRVPQIDDALEVAVAQTFSCVRRRGGAVSCAGSNAFGELGSASEESMSSRFVEVSGLTDAIAIRAGSRHACALRERGGVSCWGSDERGQLGLGTRIEEREPTPVCGPP